MLRFGKFASCVLFLAGLALACYRRPVPDDFDRYVYEAIVRARTESLDVVYSIVKHENPRAEASSVLDSPQHLQELEPLYAIRPLYLAAISAASRMLPIQSAINLISATALFGIGIVVLIWTKQPLLSALLTAATPILTLGRLGTPDAFAALFVVAALWLLDCRKWIALALLFVSLGIRTDNILILLAAMAWLAWQKKLPWWLAGALAALAAAIVAGINHWAGNYGWIVLFRYSFIGGRYPSQIPHALTFREYLSAVASGVPVILSHAAIWLLVGIVAWWRSHDRLLIVAGSAALAHFLLFPSPDDRYLVWAYAVAGIALIRSLSERIDAGVGIRESC